MPLPEVLVLILTCGSGNRLELVDAVLLPRAVVRKGAVVRRAILDDDVVVGPDARVGGGSEGEVALVGRAVELSAGTVVAPGGRLPEGD
ncbi:MAG TPA: hypothetical protein VJT79_05815 [Pseudonocardia sp.]|nr:hypothetical protein [Pseudonocardia sp.]